MPRIRSAQLMSTIEITHMEAAAALGEPVASCRSPHPSLVIGLNRRPVRHKGGASEW